VVSVVLPRGVSSIAGDALTGYTELRSLTIQSGCVEIGDRTVEFGGNLGAFGGCISLAKVTIPEPCTKIGTCAFCGCSNLTELEIPSGMRSIGRLAFVNCAGLTGLTIPANVPEMSRWTLGTFRPVAILEYVRLVGCSLSPAVVEAVEPVLAPDGESSVRRSLEELSDAHGASRHPEGELSPNEEASSMN
jgi:hypothetical protein